MCSAPQVVGPALRVTRGGGVGGLLTQRPCSGQCDNDFGEGPGEDEECWFQGSRAV